MFGPENGREREALAWLIVVGIGVVATGLLHGFNVGRRSWAPVERCQLTLSEGFVCRPLPGRDGGAP